MSSLEFWFGVFLCLFFVFLSFKLIKRKKRFIIILIIISIPLAFLIRSDLDTKARLDKNLSRKFEPQSHKIKHIILLSVDSLRKDGVSYHNPNVSTPNIDNLARDGIIFSDTIAPSPWTLPSFASIMTGLASNVHEAILADSMLAGEFNTLAEYMYSAGYYTSAIVSNSFLKLPFQLSQGFILYDVYPKTSSLLKTAYSMIFRRTRNARNISTEDLTDQVISWVEANHSKDFLLWAHYFDPHLPYKPPTKYLPKEEPAPKIGTVFNGLKFIRAGYLVPTLEERAWLRALYDSEVRYVDDNIGRLIQKLKDLGIYDSSLIVFFSDHGEEFWEHHSYEHGHTTYNELLEVPLAIKLPNLLSKGKVIDTRVQLHSILPTVLDLAGIDFPAENLSAGSLRPLWEDRPEQFDYHPVVSRGLLYFEDRESLFIDFMKYTRYLITGDEELYNLESDPQEKISISHSSPEILIDAQTVLDQYNQRGKELRAQYNLTEKHKADIDEKTLEDLRSLGYVQ